MTLPNWDALPVRTKRSRKRLYAVIKGEYSSLTAWKSLNVNVKRSKIHLHNYIASVLNLDSYEELDKQVMRSTRLWYNYVKTNASGSSPTLTITVTDGTNALSGASVKIGSTTKTSNGEGKVTFTGLTYGDYAVKVTKANYYDLDDTVRFRANHKNFTLALSELPTLTVTVTDDGETPTAINGATVTIDETSKTTNAQGKAEFKLDYGDYEASVSATGYTTKTEDIEFTSSKTSVTIEVVASSPIVDKGTVTVTCQDEQSNKLGGADVGLWDTSLENLIAVGYTESNGECTLMDYDTQEVMEIPYGNYILRANAYDSYYYTGAFVIDSVSETVTITLTEN